MLIRSTVALLLGGKYFPNFSYSSFVLSGGYFYLIFRLEVFSAFCHYSTSY